MSKRVQGVCAYMSVCMCVDLYVCKFAGACVCVRIGVVSRCLFVRDVSAWILIVVIVLMLHCHRTIFRFDLSIN